MKYRPKPTSRFQKDLKRIQKRGYQIQLIKEVVRKLSDGETLEAKYKDHPLSGDYAGCDPLGLGASEIHINLRLWN